MANLDFIDTKTSDIYDLVINMLEEDDFEYWHFHKFKTVGTKKLILTVCVEW